MHVLLSLARTQNRVMSMSFAEAAALRKAAQHTPSLRARRAAGRARSSASELPRPPPKAMPDPVTYEAVARPGAYYERPRYKRDLPIVSNQWGSLLAFSLIGVAGWGAFVLYATNQEKLSSSVVRQILQNVRDNEMVFQTLGESARPEPAWYINGDPWISGAVNTLQGNVDISFRVKGSKGAGTLYFTSIRREKGQPFTILRFKIICDDGTIISLPTGQSRQ